MLELKAPRPLREVFPGLVSPLREALEEEDELVLAESVETLTVHGVCNCGDAFCATFYTVSQADLSEGEADTIAIGGWYPFETVDIVDGQVAAVEIVCADMQGPNEAFMRGIKERHARLGRSANQAPTSNRGGALE
jgi:hypothetical protein